MPKNKRCRIAFGLLLGHIVSHGLYGILESAGLAADKLQAKAVAEREFLSEAAWLKRLVIREIRACDSPSDNGGEFIGRSTSVGQGRHADPRVRKAHARAIKRRGPTPVGCSRGSAGNASGDLCLRSPASHLRSSTPLPKDEYLALKRSIAVLESIGRNINQIAKVANQGGRIPDSAGAEFRAMLKICVALRDNTKALLKANETSWETGHVQANL